VDNIESYKVVKSEKKSELQKFAMYFHQDWKLVFPDFYTGAEMYLSSIKTEQKVLLKNQLSDFISLHRNSSPAIVKTEWLKLGAQGWQKRLNIIDTLSEFVRLME